MAEIWIYARLSDQSATVTTATELVRELVVDQTLDPGASATVATQVGIVRDGQSIVAYPRNSVVPPASSPNAQLPPLRQSVNSAGPNNNRTGTHTEAQIRAANAFYTPENIAQCGTCPESVVNVITTEVQEVTDAIIRTKRIVTLLNRLCKAAQDGIVSIIDAITALIPNPPVLDLREFLGIVTCPLTPQAIATQMLLPGTVQAMRDASYASGGNSWSPQYWSTLNVSLGKHIAGQSAILAKANPWPLLDRVGKQWMAMFKKLCRDIQRFLDTEEPSDVFTGLAWKVESFPPPRRDVGGSTVVQTVAGDKPLEEGLVIYTESQDRRGAEPIQRRDYAGQPESLRPAYLVNRRRWVFRSGDWQALPDSQAKVFVRTLFRLMDELWVTMKDIPAFALRISIASAETALVRVTCPRVYYDTSRPFLRFVEEASTFSLRGFLPAGLDEQSRPIVDASMRLFIRLMGWPASAAILLV